MYRAAARAARAGRDRDLVRDWWAQHRAVVPTVHAAPARALLQAAVAVVRVALARALLQAAVAMIATERQAAGHRVGSPEEDSSRVDSWPADSLLAAVGNRTA